MTTHLTKLQRRYGVDKPYAPAAFAAIIERTAQAARRERIAKADAALFAVTWSGHGGTAEDFLQGTPVQREALENLHPEIVAALREHEAVLAS